MGPITKFTILGFELNHLLDEGQTVSLEEVEKKIKAGVIFDWLSEKYSDIDLSLYAPKDREELNSFFDNLLNAVDAQRKMGVKNNGLSLLLAYCIEGIQQQRNNK